MSDGAEILGFPHGHNAASYPCDVEPKEYPPEEMVEMPVRGERYSPEPKKQSPRAQILSEAASLIDGERDRQHGSALECHTQISRLWTAYLGCKVDPIDVALMMVLLKTARTQTGAYNPDCFTDLCGYGALAGELAKNASVS